MNTYWLLGHKNYSVQNDSLVCHWNPGRARRKKAEESAAGSSAAAKGLQVEPLPTYANPSDGSGSGTGSATGTGSGTGSG